MTGARGGWRDIQRASMVAVTTAGAGFFAAYLYIALRRMAYPFDLEWLEGACLDHVARLMSGRRIYVRPTLTFTPFIYPPLYYYVVAAASKVFGLRLFTARLVSFASSLALFGLMAQFIRRESGSALAGVLGVGLFAATYRLGGAWLDLARIDSLFLMLTMLGVHLLHNGRGALGWTASGVAFALAALTKQTAVLLAVPIILYTTVFDWRRGLHVGATFAIVLGGAAWALDLTSRGWFLKYTVFMPQRLQALNDVPPHIWQEHILGPLGWLWAIVATHFVIQALRDWRRASFLAVLTLSFVAAAWTTGMHSGAYDDVFMPAYLAICLIAAIAVGRLSALDSPWTPGIHVVACAICGVQLAQLSYPMSAQIPTRGDFAAAASLHRSIASIEGGVFVPQHGAVSTLAQKPMTAHDWAIFDQLRLATPEDAAYLREDIHTAFATHRFAAIILDKPQPWFEADLDEYYRRDRSAVEDELLWTKTGYRTRPRWIYVPR